MKKERVKILQSLIEFQQKHIDSFEDTIIEDYEKQDMKRYLKKYPELKVIPYKTMLHLQRYYNAEVLSANWVGCIHPENLIAFLTDEIRRDNPIIDIYLMSFEHLEQTNKQFFPTCRKLGEK